MISFAVIAVVMVALALAFVLPPLLRTASVRDQVDVATQRDQANLAVLRDQLRELDADLAAGDIDAQGYADARSELERRVAQDVHLGSAAAMAPRKRSVWPAVALGVALPLAAGALYVVFGTPTALDPAARFVKGQDHEMTTERLTLIAEKLAKGLQQNPDNPQGWFLLARSYSALERLDEAADAYGHLAKLVPGNADILADYADVLATAHNKTLAGEPEKIIAAALKIDPNHLKSLALAGSAAFERHDYAAAAANWKKALAQVQPGTDTARAIEGNIAEAESLLGAPTVAAQTSATQGASAATTAVAGTVELDAALRAKVDAGDTVFIFARAVNGPPMPLAVLRKQVRDLPAAFVLDDSMGMGQGGKLSNAAQVVIGARVSKSGNATPSVGDLEGLSEPVKPGARGVVVRIGRVRS